MSEEKTATITIQIEPGKKQRMEEFCLNAKSWGLQVSGIIRVYFDSP